MLYYTLRVMNESYPVTILTLMYVIWEAFKKHVKSFFEGFPNYNQINIVRNCQDLRNEILIKDGFVYICCTLAELDIFYHHQHRVLKVVSCDGEFSRKL